MEAQANTAVAAWTIFAVSVGEQVADAENVSLALSLTPPERMMHACRSQTNLPCVLLMSALPSKGYRTYALAVWQALLPTISWKSCWWVGALGMHAATRSWTDMLMSSLQAALQTVHIKRFWEQHKTQPITDVEQMEARLVTSLQVSPFLPCRTLYVWLMVAASNLQSLCTK